MKTIFQNDDFIIDYDEENNKYRASYFEDNHFVDDCEFNGFMRHGKWAWYPDRMDRQELLCTNCEEPIPYNEDGERMMTPYCPYCGVKMDEEIK